MASGSVIGRNGSSDKAGVVAGRQSFFRKMPKQTREGDSTHTNSGIAAFWLFKCPIQKGPDYKRAVAVLLVLAMLIVPITSTISFTGGEGADNSAYNYSQSTVTYYKDSSKTESVTLSYDGTPIAEYNPEYWGIDGNSMGTKDDGSHLTESDEWSVTSVDTIIKVEVTVQWERRSSVIYPHSEIKVYVPEGWTVIDSNPGSNCVSIKQDENNGNIWYITKYDDDWGWYPSGEAYFTLQSNYAVKPVFGGWVEDTSDADNSAKIVHPGSVLEDGDILYANWISPKLYTNSGRVV